MKCQKCGAEFEGNFCPNCGSPAQPISSNQFVYQIPAASPQKKSSAAKVVIIAIASLLVVVIASISIPPMFGVSPTNAGTISSTVSSGAIEVSYQTLYKDYMDNPINADSKYKGKKLIINGQIDQIDREIDQKPYITFKITNLGDIRFDFSKGEESNVAKLIKGQTVKVVGVCNGTILSSSVILDDCHIAE